MTRLVTHAMFLSILAVAVVGCGEPGSDGAGSGTGLLEGLQDADVMLTKAPADKSGPTLYPGRPAPELHIADWVKGEPIEALEEGKVYVVEFWATWCGPCKEAMPHMAKLQKEYGDKVAFIGVTDETRKEIDPFMAQKSHLGPTWSEVLTYRIALDSESRTSRGFMEPAMQGGIPCAFIVGKTGNVEWIGHPASIDEPLKQVVAGKWDSQKEGVLFTAEHRVRNAGSIENAMKVVDDILTKVPNNANMQRMRFGLLVQMEKIKEANEYAAKTLKIHADDHDFQGTIAWWLATIVPRDRDLDLAASAAKQAIKLTDGKNADHMDTLARIYFEQGEFAQAVATQKTAIQVDAGRNPGLKRALKRYQAAAEGE